MTTPYFDSAALEVRVRSRADMVGSDFVTSAEIQNWLEAAWQELYGKASIEFEDLLVKIVDIPITQGTGTMPLPLDFKRLRALRIKDEYFLTPLSLREIQQLDRPNRQNKPKYYWLWGRASTGPGADILPWADKAYTITCYYQPALSLTDLATFYGGTGTTGNLPELACWDEYVVLSAAIKCKDKEESSVAVLVGERTALYESMRSSWTPMDTSEAGRVVALNGMNSYSGTRRAYDYTGPDDDY